MFVASCNPTTAEDNNTNNNNNNGNCGNGVIDEGEMCDSDNLAGQDCTNHEFASGVLQCNATCSAFDTSWCEGATNNTNNLNNTNNWHPPTDSRIYVNTYDTLYYIDPSQGSDMVEVGDFVGNCVSGDSGFYDIAVDEHDNLLGITAAALYTIDKETAECDVLIQFPLDSPHFFALSYVKGVDPEDPHADVLIAASVEEGEWVKIDPHGETMNTIFYSLGFYDHPYYEWVSSGDVVSVQTGAETFKTYATLKCFDGYEEYGCESDWLAEIDPENGDARLIGETGYQQIFSLGFWGDKVYGFTKDGEYILIDRTNGTSTLVEKYDTVQFWGAGNTTIPYIVQ
jgi:hypothetical protein